MATLWKEGDQVRVVNRPVTDEDRKTFRYYDHMSGLIGAVQNVYEGNNVAIKIERNNLSHITQDVHKAAIERMREKFLNSVSEEQKKQLTKEELEFDAHYVLLVRSEDLEKA